MHKWERMWDAHQPVLGQQSLCEESLDSLSRISRKIDFLYDNFIQNKLYHAKLECW